jgi:hypothetical protein
MVRGFGWNSVHDAGLGRHVVAVGMVVVAAVAGVI